MSAIDLALVTAGGTLAGAAIMGGFNIWSQKLQARKMDASERRADRRTVYARFLGSAVEILFRRAATVSPDNARNILRILAEPMDALRDRQRLMEETVQRLGDKMAELQLIASPPVVVAAEQIAIFISDTLQSEDRSEQAFREGATRMRELRNGFLRAARREISTEPSDWPHDHRQPLEL